jgi:hypothetical protein
LRAGKLEVRSFAVDFKEKCQGQYRQAEVHGHVYYNYLPPNGSR